MAKYADSNCKIIKNDFNPIWQGRGGGHYGPPTMNQSAAVGRSGLCKPNFLPWALGENPKKLKEFVFCKQNLFFQARFELYMVSSFHLRCITPLKLKFFKILNFSTIISIEICSPLATKQRDLKMFKMASQIVFRPKNVPRFSFGLLVAPKPKNQGGGHNGPPPG